MDRRVALEIRPVRTEDVAYVVALITEVLAEFGLEFDKGSHTDRAVRELPDSYASHGGAFWVAHHGGVLVGTCGVFPLDAETLELRKMYLRPTARGLGLGTALLDTAVAWAREHHFRRIVLDTTEQMTRAIAFYEANGFVRDDAQIRGARCSRGYARLL